MTQEHRYSLTRVCLRRGELTLPRAFKDFFSGDGPVTAVDSVTGTQLELDLQGERVLRGLAGFFEEHGLDVNDSILLRRNAEGGISLTAQKRERRDFSSDQAKERIVTTLLDSAPLTEAEARTLLPGLPAAFDLRALLHDSGAFRLKAGRWHDAAAFREEEFERQVDEALLQAASAEPAEPEPQEPPAGSGPTGHSGLPHKLLDLGFLVQEQGGGSWLLDSAAPGSMTGGFRVLAHELEPGVRLDWAALLEQRRSAGADHLAVFGPESDLQALTAPAELARATLWPLASLDRVLDIARDLPVGPVDLESHFRHDGLSSRGLTRFEQTVAERISERGAFSLVLANLAEFHGGASFRLEDAARGVDREAALTVLEQLSRSPFQLVVRRDASEYTLRADVHTALSQLAEYSRSLLAQMPQSRRELVAQRA